MTGPDRSVTLGRKIHAVFNDKTASPSALSRLCVGLIDEQRLKWPMLRQAYDGLENTLERGIRCAGFSVLVQYNPGRISSTLAPVSGGDTDGRPCFLCPDNLPAEQRAVLYRDKYLILPNPMPVIPFHCTVAHVRHEPQTISGRVAAFLQLVVDLGPDWTVLYNGPKCGASAPDHFHFQIIPSHRMPIENEVLEKGRCVPSGQREGVMFYRAANLGRQAVIIEGDSPASMERAFDAFLQALRNTLAGQAEPMINIIGFLKEASLSLAVFPRRKHRPDVFFGSGDDRILVSPAVLEMGGILVAPMKRDFERLDGALVEAIFAEVSLEREHVERVLEAIGTDRLGS
jgi:hypothetical protein